MKKRAVVLKYNKAKDNAPKVVAKGEGILAEKILELAKKHNIPIVEDKETVSFLLKLNIGEEIPPTLYKIIAKILSYAYNVIHQEYPSK
ncbi:EscU/YscU/HrcU family type III secretion system export apparatus switch protein [Desulfurobacterium thermolithotrophum]|uniref:EscU/YscU/HrcU family type III secretion system export apparatus switch protein n=1 Tax=Desulfurobacterium thermolithotrophum TaxID=64160 RepID=UPI0013D71704|nr:EscU/YscU/HrcU family type III secretion system export apparatus switch protein [Desulfurobacterium thermolithotrophum]